MHENNTHGHNHQRNVMIDEKGGIKLIECGSTHKHFDGFEGSPKFGSWETHNLKWLEDVVLSQKFSVRTITADWSMTLSELF